MKIIKFTAENVKKLRAVEITPSGEIVTITGRNGAGKTSVLDAIWWAIAGAKHIQAKPIRDGETKARVRLDLGEFVVERRFTEKTSTLTIEDAQGHRVMKPQDVLDAIFGELCFDPLAFTRMDAKKQYDELRRIASIEADLDALDLANKSDYAKRTDLNRDAKAKRAQAESVGVPSNLPADLVDENEILNRLQQVGAQNSERTMRMARRQDTAKQIAILRDHVINKRARAIELRKEAEDMEIHAAAMEGEAEAMQKKLESAPALPPEVDATAIRAELETAKTINAGIGRRTTRGKLGAEAMALEEQSTILTAQIAAREKVKAEAIASSKMPVPGLGFGEGCVTYNGVPFDQASTAEQIRVSMAIAMAANPKLRVIRVQDGSLLDEQSLEIVRQMAKDQDYQVWVEAVTSTSKTAIHIEDGSIVAAAKTAKAA